MAKLLIVDDDKGFLFLMGEYLESFGFDFELADSASQARSRLRRDRFDLVISDFNMPGESGLDLFRYVSSIYPRLRFILMSGCNDPRVKREAMSMGCSGFLEKPFKFADLLRMIRNPMPAKIQRRVSAA